MGQLWHSMEYLKELLALPLDLLFFKPFLV
jgi:hypothetical protein